MNIDGIQQIIVQRIARRDAMQFCEHSSQLIPQRLIALRDQWNCADVNFALRAEVDDGHCLLWLSSENEYFSGVPL